MSFDTDNRLTYAIGFIVDNSLAIENLNKVIDKVTNLKNLYTNFQTDSDDEYILKNIPEEIKLDIYIAVGDKIPKTLKDELHKGIESSLYLPNARSLWFGENYTYEEQERRLRQWIGETSRASKIFILNVNSTIDLNIENNLRRVRFKRHIKD